MFEGSAAQERDTIVYHAPRGLRLTQRLVRLLGNKTLYLVLLAVVVGVGGGYGAILFRWLIEAVGRLVFPAGTSVAAVAALPWWRPLVILTLGGALVGPLIWFFAREAKGHGVPEVINAVANRGGRIRGRVAVIKTVASAISIGVGASVGREGPIVQIGAALGAWLGQLLHLVARSLRLLVACGAAAGMAATFNAPIAGPIFALEVILGVGSIRTFTPLVVSSVVATVISRYHLGDFPAFQIPQHYHLVSAAELPVYVVLGGLAALVGVAYSRGLAQMETWGDRTPLPEPLKPLVGGLLVGALVLAFPQVMGSHYEPIEATLTGSPGYGLKLLLVLLVVKMVATQLSLASGFSGGVFAPALFLGAVLGAAVGQLANAVLPLGLVAPAGAYALVGMGAMVAATTYGPLTAILIVFEMTSDYRIIVPLMLACLVAAAVATRLSRESIYTLRLARLGVRLVRPGRDEVMAATAVETLLEPVSQTLSPGAPFHEVVERSLARGVAPLYVTTADGKLLGSVRLEDVSLLIRDEDVLEQLLVAADVMRPASATVRPQESLALALQRMTVHGKEELPVVDDQRRLIGTVSHRDVLELYEREVIRRNSDSLAFVDDEAAVDEAGQRLSLSAGETVVRLQVAGGLVGRSLRDLDLRARFEVQVVGLCERGDQAMHVPDSGAPLRAGQELVMSGAPERLEQVQVLIGEDDSG